MKKPKLTGSAPVLLVADVVAAANFYRDKLGFVYERFWGDPPSFCILWRDRYSLMLSKAEHPTHIAPHHTISHGLWNIYFWVDNVDALFAEFNEKGVKIGYGLTDQPYGVREFSIHDLDDYEIAFGQEIEP